MRADLKSTEMGAAVILLAIGMASILLGLAAFSNYSQVCYVNPGGFPCVTTYQVVILAPLYPIAAEILLIGVGLDMIGLASAFFGLQQAPSRTPQQTAQGNTQD